jgi:RHS repeat-associated protein
VNWVHYKYQVVGIDPENSQITYTLITAPSGMVIDANTGLITWNNPTLGNTQIKITATDTSASLSAGTSGAVAVQEYTLTGKQNHAPVINSTPTTQIVVGNTYRYDVKATDSDNDALTYTLDNASTTAGISIDKYGRINWKPTTTNIGIKPVTVTVTDSIGAIATQTYNLEILADNIAPTINLVRGTNIANIGETISFQVQATDNVGIKSTQLLINSQIIALDSNGVGTYTVTTAGIVTATAIVTDINGNISTKNSSVNVIDPTDVDAPNISLDLSGIIDGIVTGRTDIKGTVTDTNLDYYILEVARLGTNNWKEVFRGNNSITNGVLGKFDPTLLENDSYQIRLTAVDTSGHISSIQDEIEVTGDLKLGNFRLSFTDLTIPVTGIPISLTRTYDSLTAGTTDDFGYGWRMEFRDTDLRTSLKADPSYEELDYRTVGFNFGTRVYITLPGGRREGFTFQPQLVQGAIGGLTGGRLYYPSFVSDSGVTSTLTVPGAEYKDNTATNQFATGSSGNPNGILMERDGKLFNLAGRPYVPQDDGFGNRYLLTTKDGIQYEINATTGDLEKVTDTNGNTLTYSDSEIVSSTGVKVTFERDNQGRIVSVTDPMGAKVRYGYDVLGDLVSVKDRDGNETKFGYNAGRSHYLEKIVDPLGREAVKTEYDEAGRLKKVLDINGQGTTLTYDPNNSSETILDSYGKPTTYIYDIRGNVVNQIAANGGITTRTYDDDNNQLSETDADGVTTTYTYDDKRNITSITDENGNITRMAYGINNKITSLIGTTGITNTFTYDAKGNLISSKNADGLTSTYTYSNTGQLLTQTGVDGQITTYGYDSKGNPTQRTDSLGNTTIAVYDNLGRIISTSVTINPTNPPIALSPTLPDNRSRSFSSAINPTYTLTTSRTYDVNGLITSITDAQGNTTTSEYNALGQVSSTTDAQGNITLYTYDAKGQVIKVVYPDNTPTILTDNPFTETAYDIGGRITATTSATGLVTHYIYDAMGRLIEAIYPDSTPTILTDNPRVKSEYSLAGRVLANIDMFGNRTEYTYDPLGRVITTKDILGHDTNYTYNSGGQITSITDPKNRTIQLVYDSSGRQIETIDFDGSKSTTTYDQLSRIKTQTNPLNQTVTYDYDNFSRLIGVTDALNQTTQYQYNNRGSIISVTDALGHQTQFDYDIYNRKIATIAADSNRTSTTYDNYNRVTQTQDFNGNTTGYSYNNLNQLTAVTLADSSTTNYTYDNLGRLITTTDALHHQTNYQYDNFNRKISTILALGQQNHQTYNQFGQLTNQTDFNGDGINYAYDLIGRLTTKSFTNPLIHSVDYTYDNITSQLTTITDGRGVTGYSYDSKDRLATVTNPDGKQISYGYDIIGNLTSLTANSTTTNYTYDLLNRLDLVKVNSHQLADYDYDAVRNLIQTKLGDGTTETLTYDTRNRLTNLETVNSSGSPLSSYTYTLDANGNRTAVTELSGRQVNYTYDNVDRLTTESILDSVNGNRTISYTFDAVSNRLTRNDSVGGLTNYSYNQLNQVTSTKTGTQTTNYSYDNNGSLVQKINGANITNYQWLNDGENRLVGVTTPTDSIEYSYDAMGNRVKSVVNGTATNYLVDTNRGLAMVLQEYDASGNVLKTYTSVNGLIRSDDGTQQQFYHTDGLGTVRLLTDATGAVNTRSDYDAFGRLLSLVSGNNVYQFTGERRDSETGLDYLRARYYDSELGRFISRDAFGGWLSSPASQNKYLYAHGNPVNFTDPSGYMTMGEELKTLEIIGILAAIAGTTGWIVWNVSNAVKTNISDYPSGYANTGSSAGGGSSSGGGVLYNQGQIDGYGDRLTYGEFGSRLRFGMGGRSWTVSTGNRTSTGFSTSHDLRPAVQGALTAQGVKGVFAAGNTTQALRNWAEMTISTEPAREQIYTFPGATPQGIQPPEGYGGNPNQPIWQEWFDGNSGFGTSNNTGHGQEDNSWLSPNFMEANPNPAGNYETPTNPPQYPVIPPNYVQEPSRNGTGFIFRPPGTTGDANTIRLMPPTSQYPNGYWTQYNNDPNRPQTLNPATGKPGKRYETHVPLPPSTSR